MTTATAPVLAPSPAPAWARRAAHGIALCALPSGLWRIAMASGVYVGYSDQVLRDVFDIPGWGIVYVVGLSVLTELAALLPLLLISGLYVLDRVDRAIRRVGSPRGAGCGYQWAAI
ncbi:hypothetical protein ACWGIX_37965, partial [Streptomyces sp. NPDC054829]